MSDTYFKLGAKGEGFYFFLPDDYRKNPQVIGSDLRRTITGKAKRDVITIKNSFELGFSDMSDYEYINFYRLFEMNMLEGRILILTDDTSTYEVIWGNDSFGMSERVKGNEIYWSGTIQLEEV